LISSPNSRCLASGRALAATARVCSSSHASILAFGARGLGKCRLLGVDRELIRALGRIAQIGQDDLLAQLADGLGQRALGVGSHHRRTWQSELWRIGLVAP
jgi:hypothetical protein